MKTVYALYSKIAYESCTLKGIFFNRKDAELEVLKFNPNSYDSIEIDEIVTRYPECDMYAVVYIITLITLYLIALKQLQKRVIKDLVVK